MNQIQDQMRRQAFELAERLPGKLESLPPVLRPHLAERTERETASEYVKISFSGDQSRNDTPHVFKNAAAEVAACCHVALR
jgi:hypothetical protein